MLSKNTLLRSGRYCIQETISVGPSGTIYSATDSIRRATVFIIERSVSQLGAFEGESESLVRIQHDGLVRIFEDFEDNGRAYSATEPLSNSEKGVIVPTDRSSVDRIFDRMGAILLAINAVRSEANSIEHIEIGPKAIVTCADGKIKLLLANLTGFGMAEAKVESPFVPMELVWDRLDLITQRAVYNRWTDESLSLLESPPDARTSIYALGAVFYKLLTGIDPEVALYRTIEMLDSGADSLRSPQSINSAIDEAQSSFLIRMLEVRRERRFGSVEDAIFSLPTIPTIGTSELAVVEVEPEPLDLLLPQTPTPAARVFEPALAQPPRPSPISRAFNDQLFAAATVKRPEPKPESKILVDTRPIAVPARIIERRHEPGALSTVEYTFSPAIAPAKREKSKIFKPLAVAAVLIVSALGGWGIYTLNQSTSPVSHLSSEPPVASMTDRSDQAVAQEPVITSTSPAVENSTANTTQASQTIAADPQTEPDSASPARQNTQVAEVKSARVRDTKPAAKNEAKPKKKLTVDDLIN